MEVRLDPSPGRTTERLLHGSGRKSFIRSDVCPASPTDFPRQVAMVKS